MRIVITGGGGETRTPNIQIRSLSEWVNREAGWFDSPTNSSQSDTLQIKALHARTRVNY